MSKLKPIFQKGDNVKVISSGKVGTINEILSRDGNIGYQVTIDGKKLAYQEKYLEPFIDEEQEILNALFSDNHSGIEDYQLFQTWYRLKRPVEGNFYSYLASKTIFNPYQFKPLNKFISAGSEERLFIADEVGVGKTIETGIILTELLARGRLDRRSPVLVVCPNSLGPKWVYEMRDRFNIRFQLYDGKMLRSVLKSSLSGYIPENATWAVVSLQLLRREENIKLLQKINAGREIPLWNMVVIDEAHHLRNTTTESNFLGTLLSDLSEAMLMLSATPLNLRDSDLFNQMHILNPSLFPDLQTFNTMLSPVKSINRLRRLLLEKNITVFGELQKELQLLVSGPLGEAIKNHPGVVALHERMKKGGELNPGEIARYDRMLMALSPLDSAFTRTLKREALEHRVIREPVKIPVTLTDAEMSFYNEVVELVADAYLYRGGNPSVLGFVTNMPRRMASSCIPAMRDYLDWCLANNKIIADENIEDELVEDDLDLETIPLPPELRERYSKLLDEAVALKRVDTKYNEFSSFIKQTLNRLENPQMMVFSFFVRTLEYLKNRLAEEGYKVGLICGKVPLLSDGKIPGRFEIIEAFKKKEIDILLSSEVGGEGLDFQFCQTILNYDLPYNPMRVEQRIGRIDRFGQTADKVIVGSMYLKDTLDERIYEALYERIKLVEDSVGMLEPILGNKLVDLQKEIISGNLTQEQFEMRMEEIELSVAQAKIEMEGFEATRKELMGDDYFTNPLHNLDTLEFVTPNDASFLTELSLNQWDGCNYEQVDENRGLLVLSKDLIAAMEHYTRRPGSEGSIDELKSLMNATKPTAVLFNGSLYANFPDHVFLPPCSFWTRFLLGELEKRKKINRVFSFITDSLSIDLEPGQYLVLLFEVMIEGFRVELELAAVPVNIATTKAVVCDYRIFPRVLSSGITNYVNTNPVIEIDDPTQLVDIARVSLESQLEEKMLNLKDENEYRIKARVKSLTLGSEIRLQRLRKRIDEHRERSYLENKPVSSDYLRLIEAQIENEKKRLAVKIQSLEEKNELSMTLSLVAAIKLEVTNGGAA
jgi:superfamily II DNA or RNA helicase